MLLRIHLSKSCKPKTCCVSDWRLDLDWLSVTILKLAYITDTVCDCMHYSWAIWQKNKIMMIFFQFDRDVSQYISDRWLSLSLVLTSFALFVHGGGHTKMLKFIQ